MNLKQLRLLNKLLIVFLLGFIIYEWTGEHETIKKITTTLCIIAVIVLPYILKKLKIYSMSEILKFMLYIFYVLASVFGEYAAWYYRIWWWDLLVHFLSGIFCSMIAVNLLIKIKSAKKETWIRTIFFIMIFALSIAVLWEFLEFACDQFLGTDSQWVHQTGVRDTMTDMLIAWVGSVLFSFHYAYKIKKQEKKTIEYFEKVL